MNVLGSPTADAEGNATLSLTLPGSIEDGDVLAFQALAIRGVGGEDTAHSAGVQVDVGGSAGPCPVYADPTILPGGDGSLADPYPSIAYALDGRDACTDIRLLPGTYYESLDFGADNLDVRSTDGPDLTIIESPLDDVAVTIAGGQDSSAVLEGLTLRGLVHGLEVQGASPTLRDLDVRDHPDSGAVLEDFHGTMSDSTVNSNDGGGVEISNSNAVLRDNMFASNHAPSGAGLYIDGGTVILEGNTFQYNDASVSGGGIYLLAGTLDLAGANRFYDNDGLAAAGLWLGEGSTTTMTGDNAFEDHVWAGSQSDGVAVYIRRGAAVHIEEATFDHNERGVFLVSSGSVDEADVSVVDSAFTEQGYTDIMLYGSADILGNTLTNTIGANHGIYLWDHSGTVANNLLEGHNYGILSAHADAAGLVAHNTVLNSLYYNYYRSQSGDGIRVVNNQFVGAGSYNAYSNGGIFEHNNVWDAPAPYQGTDLTGLDGNLAVDPKFVSDEDANLVWGSLCIDAGADLSAEGIVSDHAGAVRPQGLGYDMGAFESY